MKLLKIILFVFLSTIVYSQELDYRFMTNKIVFKKGKNTVSSSMNNIIEFNYNNITIRHSESKGLIMKYDFTMSYSVEKKEMLNDQPVEYLMTFSEINNRDYLIFILQKDLKEDGNRIDLANFISLGISEIKNGKVINSKFYYNEY